MKAAAPPNAAIYYTKDAFDVGDQPMGRRMAGHGFLRGFIEHAGVDAFHGYCITNTDRTGFGEAVRRLGGTAPVHVSHRLDTTGLAEVGAVYVSAPIGSEYAFQRRAVNQRAWSLVGITHTVSSNAVADAVADLVTAPMQSWDAMICTSRAVKAVIETMLAQQADYLRARLGATAPSARLQLPVIPLGVRCQDFAAAPAGRTAMRQRLGVPDDAVLVLFAARLSFHAKAHPFPMYLALQRAAKRTGKKVHLLLAGWFNAPHQERVFREGAAELCPDVVLHVVDGRDPVAWDQVWQAGDIYTLLSDNIQESFGISPVEAMAAGLPVVGSDWNGLKDTIVHGKTGFLAPTLAPPPNSGIFFAHAYENGQVDYDNYVGAVAQTTSVDIGAAADAFSALIADAELRRTMGEAARARALSVYDWSRVIPEYQALWAELAARRSVDTESAPPRPGQPGNPARADPFETFAAYPTRVLTAKDRVTPAVADLKAAVAALAARPGSAPVLGVSLAHTELEPFAGHLIRLAGATVDDIIAAASPHPTFRVVRTLTWLHKHGLIEVEPNKPAPPPGHVQST